MGRIAKALVQAGSDLNSKTIDVGEVRDLVCPYSAMDSIIDTLLPEYCASRNLPKFNKFIIALVLRKISSSSFQLGPLKIRPIKIRISILYDFVMDPIAKFSKS